MAAATEGRPVETGTDVAIVIPAMNEAAALRPLADNLNRLNPRPAEIVLVDGASTDGTAELARHLGFHVLDAEPGRARQINRGVASLASRFVCVLHADTQLPAGSRGGCRRCTGG